MAENNKPKYSYKAGAFSVSVFVQDKEIDGKTVSVPSSNLQKSWTTNGKDWDRASISFFNLSEVTKARIALENLERELVEKNYTKEETKDE